MEGQLSRVVRRLIKRDVPRFQKRFPFQPPELVFVIFASASSWFRIDGKASFKSSSSPGDSKISLLERLYSCFTVIIQQKGGQIRNFTLPILLSGY